MRRTGARKCSLASAENAEILPATRADDRGLVTNFGPSAATGLDRSPPAG
jgi:hypothetical protein